MTASVDKKMNFVRWFLKHHRLKRRECVWILNYFLSNEEILESVHFVDDIENCSRGMLMSTTTDVGVPFRFYKEGIMTANAEKAFNDLRLNKGEKMYVQINYPERNTCERYLKIESEEDLLADSEKVSKEIEALVDDILRENELSMIQVKIDKALDSKDEELFLELSRQLSELMEQNLTIPV